MANPRVYSCGRGCIRLVPEHGAVLDSGFLPRIPKNVIRGSRKSLTSPTRRRAERYLGNRILRSEHFIHQRPHSMDILISDLYEDAPTLRQQLPRYGQPIAQVRQVRVDPVPPRVAERLHLLGLAADVLGLAVLHVAAGRGPLEVRVELDAVGRVHVDALHLAAQALALGQRRHHLEAVAQDHAVRPVGVVPVELGPRLVARQAVEVGEQVGLSILVPGLGAAPAGLACEVVHEDLGVHLLLDEQGRGLRRQLGRARDVLAAPHELGVEVAVAALEGDADGVLVGGVEHRFVLGGGDVRREAASCLRVETRRDVLVRVRFLAMRCSGHAGRVDWRASSKLAATVSPKSDSIS